MAPGPRLHPHNCVISLVERRTRSKLAELCELFGVVPADWLRARPSGRNEPSAATSPKKTNSKVVRQPSIVGGSCLESSQFLRIIGLRPIDRVVCTFLRFVCRTGDHVCFSRFLIHSAEIRPRGLICTNEVRWRTEGDQMT